MGEVYRARDPRLGREVAIKALPADVAQDPDRRARFEREAQLLASLNHPNIAAIHGLEEGGGAKYLVLELVQGRTLGELLAEGPMSADEAASIALQIAEALTAAHEKGIIHRDLKPGNVMVTPEHKVKVLDFGLGKALDSEIGRTADPSSTPTAHSPTMTMAAAGGTQAGLILGTAAYMSPEQAKGRPADRRSDVWGFGCLLYEMLAGKPAFQGEDAAEILAHVVRGDPDWAALPTTVPASLRALVERCLIKDRTKRLSDMSVVRFVLQERTSASAITSAPAAVSAMALAPAASTTRWPLVAGMLVVALLAGAGVMRLMTPAPKAETSRPIRLSIALPYGDELGQTNYKPVAISPDGNTIVYVAQGSDGLERLYRRALDKPASEPIPETEGARSPFFSPDGKWLGFFARGKLKKVTLDGTGAQVLADASDARGGCWAPDDTIWFTPSGTAGLLKVPAAGGAPVQATTPDHKAGEFSHRWPRMLPDGKTLLYSMWTGPGTDEHSIIRMSLATGEKSVLVRGGDDGTFVDPDHLVYGRLDTLLAAPWKPSNTSLAGAVPFTLSETPRLENEGSSAFAVSPSGTLVYAPGGPQRSARQLVWVDRAGHEDPVPVPDRDFESVALSPDEKQAAVQLLDGTIGIWMYDFARRTLTPFETSASHSSQAPLWSPDGKTIYYRGTRTGQRNVYAKAADGASPEVRLSDREDVVQTPTSISPDGKWLIYTEGLGGGPSGAQAFALHLEGDKAARPILQPGDLAARVSPDGKWIAFMSARSGVSEIYVAPFPGPGAARQVSTSGGRAELWSHDGHELFYVADEGFMAVEVSSGPAGLSFGTPHVLYADHYRPAPNANTPFSVTSDGKRFLRIRQASPEGPLNRIDVVLHWTGELRH